MALVDLPDLIHYVEVQKYCEIVHCAMKIKQKCWTLFFGKSEITPILIYGGFLQRILLLDQ